MTTPDEDDFNIDDFLADSGFTHAGTPEAAFFADFSAGEGSKLYTMRWWLNHELSLHKFLTEQGCHLITTINRKAVPYEHVVRMMLRYYFLMHHHPRFYHSVEGRPRLDMERTIDIAIVHPEIVKVTKTNDPSNKGA